MKNRPGGALLQTERFKFFPAAGGGSAASQFNSIDFHVTHRFFVTFFTEESNVPLVPSFSLVPRHTIVSLATTRG